MKTEQLQNTFSFSPSDLEANRRGEITEWQRRLLAEKQATARYGFALPGVPVAFLVLFGRNTTAPPMFLLIMIAMTVYLAYFAYTRWRSLRLDSQMIDGVASVYGWTSKQVSRSRYSTTYWLEINGNKFKVSRWQYDNFVGGVEYRLFYAPLSRTILSVEAEESRGNQPGYFAERLGKL